MSEYLHQRHLPPSPLTRPRELVLACPPMHSNVNLARIVRLAGCSGVTRMVVCGGGKIDRAIARDAIDVVEIEKRRSLPPVIKAYKADGYQAVGLEQTTSSQSLYDFVFERRTLLVIGHERRGLDEESLSLLDRVAEIPVYGSPASYNVATATTMAVYEYCRQFPSG